MTILKKVKGGWVTIQHEDLYYTKDIHMITQERKSKYKHKITVTGNHSHDMREWCKDNIGPGG